MTTNVARAALLEQWMHDKEGEHCEFRERRASLVYRTVQVLSALANDGGGPIIWGVTNDRPRKQAGGMCQFSLRLPRCNRCRGR